MHRHSYLAVFLFMCSQEKCWIFCFFLNLVLKLNLQSSDSKITGIVYAGLLVITFAIALNGLILFNTAESDLVDSIDKTMDYVKQIASGRVVRSQFRVLALCRNKIYHNFDNYRGTVREQDLYRGRPQIFALLLVRHFPAVAFFAEQHFSRPHQSPNRRCISSGM